MRELCLIMLLFGAAWHVSPVLAADTDDWQVAENNSILHAYVGKTTQDGTELILELRDMLFYSNQRLWDGVFVNGRIAYIREFNNEDSYIRVVVQLPKDEKQITAYAGVIKAPDKIDSSNHAALWKAFVNSPHQPFRADLGWLPAWDASNPIRERRLRSATRPEDVIRARTLYFFANSDSRLKPEERSQKAKEVLDPTTGDTARFYAVRALAISGYTRDGAEALAIVATDRKHDDTVRGYAAMGLQNFSSSMPPAVQQPIQKKLQRALEAEMEKLPDGLMRTLIAWGDADYIREVLGDRLRGHRMEVEILECASARKRAVDRLWEMYQTSPKPKSDPDWLMRFRIGAGLVRQEDKRGVDILIECLTVREPCAPSSQSPTAKALNEESFRQSLSNTYAWLARATGQNFGYVSNRWTPELPRAIDEMVGWWKEHRDTFEFPAVRTGAATAPSIEAAR
jgi:hypothetical protein